MSQDTESLDNGRARGCQTEFEDAIELTGTGRFHNLLLFTCGIGLIGVVMEILGTSFMLPSAQCDFNLSSSDKGLLNALFPIGIMCGSHMWGYLADTRGRKKTLVASFALNALSAIFSSFIHVFWIFLLMRFICGFLIAGASSITYAYFGEFHTSERRNRGLMWLSVSLGIGICIQPGLAWLVLPQHWEWYLPWCVFKSWRFFIIISELPSLMCALILHFWLPETPKFFMSVGKEDEALKVLTYMYCSNTGKSTDKYPVKSVVLVEEGATQNPFSGKISSFLDLMVQMRDQTVPLFKPPFLWKILLACFIQFGLYASANGLSLWLPDIFNHQAIYFAQHPSAEVSTCQIYNTVQKPIELKNRSHSINGTMLQLMKSMDLHENDSYTVICEKNILILNVNNSTEIPIQLPSNILECLDDTFLYSSNGSSLQVDMNETITILTVLNTSISRYLSQNEVDLNNAISTSNNETECSSEIDMSAYQNTLINGAAGAISLTIIGYLVGPLGKKPIIMCSLIAGGIAGLLLDHVNANWEFFLVSLLFVTLSGMCIAVVVSIVVEVFPTNLRAMAVCLSLMCGRLGSFTAHMLMGTLLETNCLLMTYLLGGLCICCGFMTIFLPSENKKIK